MASAITYEKNTRQENISHVLGTCICSFQIVQKFGLLLVLLYAKPAWVLADTGIVTKVIQKCALWIAFKWIQFLTHLSVREILSQLHKFYTTGAIGEKCSFAVESFRLLV